MLKNISIEIKWAVLFSIVGLIWMVLEKASGLHDQYIDYHLYLTNLFAIPAILMMIGELKDKKKNFYEGEMTYRQGFVSGLILSIFIALLSPITQWITSYAISPEYFPNVIKRSVELGYYPTTEAAQEQFNYNNYAIQGAIGAIGMGIITVAIAMLFLKSKNEKI